MESAGSRSLRHNSAAFGRSSGPRLRRFEFGTRRAHSGRASSSEGRANTMIASATGDGLSGVELEHFAIADARAELGREAALPLPGVPEDRHQRRRARIEIADDLREHVLAPDKGRVPLANDRGGGGGDLRRKAKK